MDSETHTPDAVNDDKREIFARLNEHSVAIASLKSGLESVVSSMESGFRNVGNRLDDLVESQRSSRPQLGIIASVFISGCVLVGALAGFALKSAVSPLAGAIEAQAVLQEKVNDFHEKHLDEYQGRIRELEIEQARTDERTRISARVTDLIVEDAIRSKLQSQHTHQ